MDIIAKIMLTVTTICVVIILVRVMMIETSEYAPSPLTEIRWFFHNLKRKREEKKKKKKMIVTTTFKGAREMISKMMTAPIAQDKKQALLVAIYCMTAVEQIVERRRELLGRECNDEELDELGVLLKMYKNLAMEKWVK